MTARQVGSVLSAIGVILFVMSELTKSPKERMVLSKDSKIAGAVAQFVSVL